MLVLALASFLGLGVVLVLVGSNQAELARGLGLDLAASGLLAAALSLGLGVGLLAAGPAVDRLPRRPLFLGFVALAVVGLLSAEPGIGLGRALASMALIGLGVGAYETLLNAEVTERYAASSARALTGVHSAATVGAVVGAPLLGWLATQGGWIRSFHWTGFGFLALLALGVLARFAPGPGEAPAGANPPRPPVALLPGVVPYALAVFCYVGVETSLTLFAVPYARDALGLPEARGVRAISAFWLGLLGGRLWLVMRGGRPGARPLVAAGVVSALALAAAVGLRVAWLEVVVLALGMLLGTVFPLVVALAADRFAAARGSAVGIVAGAGALGGMVVPWLSGLLGDCLGVELAVGGLALWCLGLAAAAWRLSR